MLTVEGYLVKVTIPRTLLLRIVYLVWCVGISAYTLGSFTEIVEPYLAVRYDYKREAIMVAGQVVFQWIFMSKSSTEERMRYMFIALTVSMIGSLMLLPLVLCDRLATVSALTATAYFLVVVGLIFGLHYQLVMRNSLPSILCYTWVLYRSFLLLFVLVPR